MEIGAYIEPEQIKNNPSLNPKEQPTTPLKIKTQTKHLKASQKSPTPTSIEIKNKTKKTQSPITKIPQTMLHKSKLKFQSKFKSETYHLILL